MKFARLLIPAVLATVGSAHSIPDLIEPRADGSNGPYKSPNHDGPKYFNHHGHPHIDNANFHHGLTASNVCWYFKGIEWKLKELDTAVQQLDYPFAPQLIIHKGPFAVSIFIGLSFPLHRR
jgi:hypothetical protein